MKPFLLRMSKAHYLINLQLYVESHPIQTHQTYRWAETHMVSNHYQVFLLCFAEDDRPGLDGLWSDHRW